MLAVRRQTKKTGSRLEAKMKEEDAELKLAKLGQRKPLTTRFTRNDTNQTHERFVFFVMFRVNSWSRLFAYVLISSRLI